MGAIEDFTVSRQALGLLLEDLRQAVKEALEDHPEVDSVSARVKSPDQFAIKTAKQRDGAPRYKDPLREIQDQMGIRVVVKFEPEVPGIVAVIEALFNQVERLSKQPENPEEFGYEATHLVCFVPPDLMDQHRPHIGFFEVQVCTLFQHAWAEANHDIGYKPGVPLSPEQRKLKSWAAASAWAADRAFAELRKATQDSTTTPKSA
jgi:ppGpp synthetase/RelA/SpoT-type nucleotidyltranferase